MNKKVVVFGSFVVDLTSRQEGLPSPGQTLLGESFKMGPGGKGSNQAVAAHRAGADVTMITKLGRDVFGKVALDFYEGEDMDCSQLLFDEERETGVALIMVDTKSAQNEIVVVPASCNNISPDDVESRRSAIEGAKVLLLQMEINFDALFSVIEIAHKAGVKVILNPAPANSIPDDIMSKVDIVTPNETEAQALTGIEVKDIDSARRAAEVFFKKGVKGVVITLGSLGAYANDREREELVSPIPVKAIDTTGAGDAFNGGFAMALAEGWDIFKALRYGNVTGALSVTRLGTAPAMPLRSEIDDMYYRIYGDS